MKHKKIERKQQLNTKLSTYEMDQVDQLNTKLFNGKKNKSDMGRFLITLALEHLASHGVKVETKTVVLVDGNPVGVQ